MIENVMYVEELLHNLQFELWDIGPLQPSDFVARLQMYQLSGWEDKVVGLLRQAVHEYQAERAIMKYLYIADKLVKVPGYPSAAPHALVDLYCDVFYFLFAQKCNKQLEELKILRKFWVGSIHPFYLAQMKDNLLARTGIDIDALSKPETIAKIKAHYANKLNMTPEEISRHFPPQTTTRYSEQRTNKKYVLQNKPNYSNFYQGQQNTPIFQVQSAHFPYPTLQQSYIHEAPQVPNDPRLTNGEAKRKRFASEETRAVVPTLQNYEPKPKKQQHRQQPKVDYKFMLSRLKEINRYQCRECGICFNTAESLERHKDEHLRQKLLAIDGGRSRQGGALCSQGEWLRDESGKMRQQLFVIGEAVWGEEGVCACCCCEMVRSWVDDQWVFVNASIVSIEGERSIMHKSCQRILEKSQKNKERP